MEGDDFYRLIGRLGLVQLVFLLIVQTAYAGSATWNLNPTSEDWNTAANWTPETVPNGSSDTATFDVSNITDLSIATDIELDAMIFEVGANPYSFTLSSADKTFTFSGAGVMNNSGQVQAFVLDPEYDLRFLNSATAGTQTNIQGGTVEFHNNSSAGSSTFTVVDGQIDFYDVSTAGDGVFMVGGFDQPPSTFAQLFFFDQSSAGNGYFVVNSSSSLDLENHGFVVIDADATADNATFINLSSSFTGGVGGLTHVLGSGGNGTFVAEGSSVQGGLTPGVVDIFGMAGSGSYTATSGTGRGAGGLLFFSGDADGQTARCTVLGNAHLQLSTINNTTLSIGSLEGDGFVYLTLTGHGSKQLTVGTNNLDTTFSGVILDTTSGNSEPGSLGKVGTGIFTLSGANTYRGGTTVTKGTLLVTNTTGSGTGTGPVSVNSGALGGSGTIAGAVTVGTGSGTAAFLAPALGPKKQSTLTIQRALTFNSDATYTYTFRARGTKARADQVIANGVTINSGAFFAFQGTAQGTLQLGLTFTAIKNTSATPIAGTFSNLPDGAILTVNGNNFQASYEGGDGNDLTLTVVQ
jgi:autotransporter-associated beta strand protein